MAKAGAKILKILRYIVWIFATIIVTLVFISVMLFETSIGQKTSGAAVARFLTKHYINRFEIEKFSFGVGGLKVLNVSIYDQYDTLMVFVPELRIRYNSVFQNPDNIRFNTIDVTNPIINAKRHKREELFNYEYLVKRLFPIDTINGPPSSRFSSKKIVIRNGIARYCEPQRVPALGLMQYHDFYFTKIHIRLKDFLVAKGKINTQIVSLVATDKSSFTIKKVSGKLLIDGNQINITNMALKAENSELYGSFGFFFESYHDFIDFIPKVEIRSKLVDSRIFVQDLRFFSDQVSTDVQNIFIEGNIMGTVDNMKGNDMVVNFGKDFKYIGSAKLVGLPYIDETFVDLDAVSLYFNFQDILSLVPSLSFPDILLNSGRMHFKGKYTGFVNDFVAYGNLNTKFGNITSDINLKLPAGQAAKYSGNINLKDFDIGSFLNIKQIGKTSFSGSVSGIGFSLDEISATIAGSAPYFDYNNYRYSNLDFDGNIIGKMITGKFKANDPNLNLNFEGTIDLSKEKPEYKFAATFKNTDLKKLNFTKDKIEINCFVDLDIKASNIEDIEGRGLILNSKITTEDNSYVINTMFVQSKPFADKKNLLIKSDLFELSMDGKFVYQDIPALFINNVSHYLDSSLLKPKPVLSSGQVVNFDVNLINAEIVNKVLKTNMTFENNSKIKGSISQNDFGLRINANVPGFKIDKYYFTGILGNVSTKGNLLSVYTSVRQLEESDSVLAQNVNLSAASSKFNTDYSLYLFHPGFSNHLSLAGAMNITNDTIITSLTNSYITTAQNEKWNLSSKEIFINFKPEIQISFLELKNEKHSIRAVGVLSKENEMPLRIILDNTNINNIESYLPFDISMFSGMLNGQMVIFNALGNASFDAAISVNPLYYENQFLGTLVLSSSHNPVSFNTNINGIMYSENMDDIMHVSGYLDLVKKKNIDLTIEVPQTDLTHFSPFFSYLASDVSGEVNGQMRFVGPLSNYKVSGLATVSNAYFTIDYTKTRYHFSDKIEIDEKGIYLKNIIANDNYGNTATIFGSVRHNYFQNFYLNIGVIAKNLHGLNTTSETNEVYYGTAFASGRIDITGPLDNIRMDMQIKSEKNTKVSLIAYDDNTFGNYKFIRFSHGPASYRHSHDNYGVGVVVNLDMEITPDADIEIIFDPVTDDIIRGKGSGNLKFLLDEYGNNNMWGSFFIEDGTYTFKALITRKFTVKKGSSIIWKGDVFEADANIEAVYRIEASVYNLIKDNKNVEDKELYRQTLFPVEAKLLLTGNLFAPSVSLDFDILNTNSLASGQQLIFLNQQVANIKSNEQELNKQVISLLLINSFLPPETGIGGISADNTFNANLGSLFSNQWNQLLSGFSRNLNLKYISNVQVGLNYANEKQYQRELDLLMSGSLFNDRVEFSGSYDIQNVNANFQVNIQPSRTSKWRIKVFNKSDNNIVQKEDINRQGVGLFIKQDFDKWSELFRRKKKDLSLK